MGKINVLKYIGVLFVWLLFLKPCVGSSFTVWSGPGCNTQGLRFSNCGCFSIPFHGGYEFEYGGQSVALYNSDACQGAIDTQFGASASGCTGFVWNSISVLC
ncbi:hypothetical protein SUGI_0540630 [Cryptomeria japonica]|nr:hypothetical protein SUGI_0540630 [Cryptomeria japonica]